MHVSHACNLTCESCSHFSGHGISGNLDPGDAEDQMRSWSNRVAPRVFSLLGGEPTINPRLIEIVGVAVKCFPVVEVATNGFFLDRHPGLGEALGRAKVGRFVLSEHSGEYAQRFGEWVALAEKWRDLYGLTLEIRRYSPESGRRWTRRYRGFGGVMRPYLDDQPRKAWEICPAKRATQLYDGALWKCPMLAYLGLQKDRFPSLSSDWDRGLAYEPLLSSCTDHELASFLSLEDEKVCGLCPSSLETFEPRSPLIPARRLLG